MKSVHFLSILLSAFVVASPIADSGEAGEIHLINNSTRSSEYEQAITAHPGLEYGQYYWFTLEWPLGIEVGDGDEESKAELLRLQQKFGFEHIGIVAGQVTSRWFHSSHPYQVLLFSATELHMIKSNTHPGNTKYVSKQFSAQESKRLKFGGQTTADKIAAAEKAGKAYVNDHGIYAVNGNNGNDFVHAVKKFL